MLWSMIRLWIYKIYMYTVYTLLTETSNPSKMLSSFESWVARAVFIHVRLANCSSLLSLRAQLQNTTRFWFQHDEQGPWQCSPKPPDHFWLEPDRLNSIWKSQGCVVGHSWAAICLSCVSTMQMSKYYHTCASYSLTILCLYNVCNHVSSVHKMQATPLSDLQHGFRDHLKRIQPSQHRRRCDSNDEVPSKIFWSHWGAKDRNAFKKIGNRTR